MKNDSPSNSKFGRVIFAIAALACFVYWLGSGDSPKEDAEDGTPTTLQTEEQEEPHHPTTKSEPPVHPSEPETQFEKKPDQAYSPPPATEIPTYQTPITEYQMYSKQTQDD